MVDLGVGFFRLDGWYGSFVPYASSLVRQLPPVRDSPSVAMPGIAATAVPSPRRQASGSQEFVDRMRDCLQQPHPIEDVPKARRLCSLDPVLVVAATAEHYGVGPDAIRRRRSSVADRDLAAWLATQLTSATQRELAPYFGRTHPASIRHLTRRIDAQLKTSRTLKKDVKEIHSAFQETVNRVWPR